MQAFNVVLLVAAAYANVIQRSAPKTAIGAIATKLPAGFSISDADADANGSVTWKELYDALNPLKIPNLDTGVVKGLVTKFAVDGPKEGAGAGLDKAEFSKMVAYLKKESADALIPKDPDEFDTGCFMKANPITEDEDKGLTYRGLVTSTVSGRTCQNWLEKKPQEIPDDLKPDKENGLGNHNFCRNPDQSMDKPWCYTMDPTKEKEVCEIPECETNSRDFQDEAESLGKEVAEGLECDCIEQLYGSTTTTADTAVPLLVEVKKKFGSVNLEVAKKKCKCKKGSIAVLKRRHH